MHALIALGVFAGLVGFAFGETAARVVVGSVLITIATLFLLLVFLTCTGRI